MIPEKDFVQHAQLLQEIHSGSLLVTGNLRLARSLIQGYDRHLLENKHEVWQSAAIYPWSTWLHQSWEKCVLEGLISAPELLLSADQELQIWQQVISDSEQGSGLLRIQATAKKIQSAWNLMHNWQLVLCEDDVLGDYDAEIFLQWIDAFKTLCAENHWLSASQILTQLLQVETKRLSAALGIKKILLLGFDELSPIQKALLNHLKIDIQWYDFLPDSSGHSAHRLGCYDSRDEMQCVSYWVKHQQQKDPQLKIGIIVPDLAQQRQALLHSLDMALSPANIHPHKHNPGHVFNLSLGRPLAEYALIRAAFLVLELIPQEPKNGLSIEPLSKLLRSPFFFGWEQEMHSRAILDRRLRRERQDQISLRSVLYFSAQKQQAYYAPLLTQTFTQTQAYVQDWPKKDFCKHWAERFEKLLKKMGWGSGRSLNSEEYQVFENWQKLLARLTTLDAVIEPLSHAEALSLLQNMALETLFQAQSSNSLIQVMGLYEATGLHFDAVWIMGMYDGVWPTKANPDNFIPLELQRRLNMPHSSAKRELEVARLITNRLIYSAKNVIFSYPLLGEQNEELGCSPLLESLPIISKKQLQLQHLNGWKEAVAASTKVQEIVPERAPAIQQSKVSGGSTLFKYQAACPFRAFAEFRLHSRAFEKAEPGLDALQRGGIVHKAMELAWREIKDHTQLLHLRASGQLEKLLQQVIEQALADVRDAFQRSIGERFIQIETTRIKQQLMQWFNLEALRAPFAVDRLEQQLQSDINGVLVDIVIDRIDCLTDQRRVLIDYKTASVRPSQWFGSRPEEPQLPLYSSVVGEPKAAILFAQIKTADMGFKGIVADTDLIPELPPKRGEPILKEAAQRWDEILQEWMLILQQLAADFRQGKADVEPKNLQQTCQYCQLSALCRIDELVLAQSELNPTEQKQ